jgi:PEP-CTERM motif
MKNIKSLLAASVVAALAPGVALAATPVVGAKSITITSALSDYLQIAEILAFNVADVNVALASNGGVATALSQFFEAQAPQGGPEETNDGVFPANYDYSFNPNVPGVYHSGGAGPNEFVTITFAASTTLKGLTIFGRGDCCAGRDLYAFTIRDANNAVLATGGLDARQTGSASVSFPLPTGGVPEPSAWALMILGFAGAGVLLRRRTGSGGDPHRQGLVALHEA